MELKYNLAASVTVFIFSQNAVAQQRFNEMPYSPSETTFRLNTPSKPALRLYETGQGGKAYKKVRLVPSGDNTWTATVEGDLKSKFYTFDIGHGETPGVLAKAIGCNGGRGVVVDMKETNPTGWESDRHVPTKSSADLTIYELHHRDFSIDLSSGSMHKGKYLALAGQKAIDRLKKLGINAVHTLLSFDSASIDESKPDAPQYNWGYDPLNYNVPEGSYSYDVNLPTRRIMEFKQMVQALYKAGVRVTPDVVYNHTLDPTDSNFERTYPRAYYRYKVGGAPLDGTGCGNETASERPLVREHMLEPMKYRANEYYIDGLRVDLMGVHDIQTMNDICREFNAIDPEIFVYGEGWSVGTCAYPLEKLAIKAVVPQMPGIAASSDDICDALHGPFSNDHKPGMLGGVTGLEGSLKVGTAGMIDHPQVDYSKVNYSKKPYAIEPTQMISYVSCHDDLCLVDRLKASIPETEYDENELICLDKLAQTAILISQGVPFILSGEEMLRNKKGVHNSFNLPDSINHPDWNNLKTYPQAFNYYSGLISPHKAHPAFRLGRAGLVRKHLEFLPVQDCLAAFCLKDHAGGDKWKNIYATLSVNEELRTVNIPKGQYMVACANGEINEAGLGRMEGGKVMANAQSALILHD